MSVSSSFSTIKSEIFDLEGLEEEGDLVINIQKVKYKEDLNEYTDEKICNELKDLIKLDFNTFFGNMSYYDTFFQNIISTLRNTIKDPYYTGDESLYSIIESNIFPLFYVNRIKVVDAIKSNDDEQILWEFLQERQFLLVSSESLITAETRAIKHACPFKIPDNVDPNWLVSFNNDTDVVMINDGEETNDSFRMQGPYFIHPAMGKHKVYDGDVFPFRGFIYYGKIDGNRTDIKTFNVDNYLNNIKVLQKGDNVSIYFHIGELIDGNTQVVSKGVIESIDNYIIHLRIGSRVLHYCHVDLSVNNCFIYGQQYEGEIYSKKMLFNSNWAFLIDEDPMLPSALKKLVFPNVNEGSNIFPELNNVKNFNEVRDLLGGMPYGLDNTKSIVETIRNKLKAGSKKKVSAKKRKANNTLVSKLPIFMFQKNDKIFSKYFGKYMLNDTFIDGDIARFTHLSNNPHMLYAYVLNMMLKKYPTKFTKIPRIDSDKVDKKRYTRKNNTTATDFVFENVHQMMLSRDFEDGKTAFVSKNNKYYTFSGGYWKHMPTDVHNSYMMIPYKDHCVNTNYLDHEKLKDIRNESKAIVRDVSENIDGYLRNLKMDINKHTLLGSYVQHGSLTREYTYTNKIDYDAMVGDDEEINEIVEVAENINAYEIASAFDDVVVDSDLADMFEQPVGIIVRMFMELFSISIDINNIKIMLYNISKYNNFQELKDMLSEKERTLRIQVQKMMKNKSLDKAKLAELTKKRLLDYENQFMSTYYAKIITMVVAFFILYIQMSLPVINIKPLSIPACNNTFSYTGYPYDDNPKSMIAYFACIISKLYLDSGPFKIAKEQLQRMDIKQEVRNHIDNILKQKPHYNTKLAHARKAMKISDENKNEHSEIFYGFRPDVKAIKTIFPGVKTDDLVMNRQQHPYVNSCCIKNVTTRETNVVPKQKRTINNVAKTKRFIKSSYDGIVRIEIPPIRQKRHNIINHIENDNRLEIQTFQAFMNAFCESNELFRNDTTLQSINNDFVNENAWNEISSIVTLKWQQLFKTLKSSDEQKNTWYEVFIRQEERYRDPHVVKNIFENIVRTIIPSILGKGVNDYIIDSRRIESKTFIPAKDRDVIINYLLDKETAYLINILRENDNIKNNVRGILRGSFSNIHTKFVSDTTYVYKVILFYNYVLLKVMLSILGVDIQEYGMNVNIMSDFVAMMLTKMCNVMDANYVNIDELKIVNEKQRENVKQDLMRKMQNLSKEDRYMFRTMKDKTGVDLDYLDRMQAQTREILANLKNTDIVDEQVLEDVPEDIPMDWIGENPDDIEVDDDGSGY